MCALSLWSGLHARYDERIVCRRTGTTGGRYVVWIDGSISRIPAIRKPQHLVRIALCGATHHKERELSAQKRFLEALQDLLAPEGLVHPEALAVPAVHAEARHMRPRPPRKWRPMTSKEDRAEPFSPVNFRVVAARRFARTA